MIDVRTHVAKHARTFGLAVASLLALALFAELLG
jgi:hypothetical protein